MNSPTKKQEETLREFLHEAVVPLIEDVLVKKLGQAMSYAIEQFTQHKRECERCEKREIELYNRTDDELKQMIARLSSILESRKKWGD